MTNQARLREAQYIPRQSNSPDFEAMCVHIYGEKFHSIGVRQYGRQGQGQSGLDILFHDFRKAPVDKAQGMVLVQCKYTTKEELSIPRVKEDVLSVLDLIGSGKGYEGVYLFIVATNAQNDKKLHDALQLLKVEQRLPFEIEVHSWDKLCQSIIVSDRLWGLYNNNPSMCLETEYRLKVYVLTQSINSHLEKGFFLDAHFADRRRKNLEYTPGYGSNDGYLPDEICMRSAPLREALLNLYTASADSHSALAFREYEFNLGAMQSGDTCLDYLHAQRIVGNLRSPDRTFLYQGETPQFAQLLTRLVNIICDAQASPDCLGALALLLIMESEDHFIQDAAINMMRDRVERDRGTKWEMDSRIAHAVIRYYYVLRRGWAPPAKYYALGDSIESIRRSNPLSSTWGSAFNHDERLKVLIAGYDPLEIPRYSGVNVHFLIRQLGKSPTGKFDVDAWPKLSAQCRVYSAADYAQSTATWRFSTSKILSSCRVVDFDALAMSAGNGDPRELLQKYTVLTTERTFERLLGYRAFLRAYVERTGEKAGKYAPQLAAIESLIRSAAIVTSKTELSPGRLWVSAVYDNPPPRLNYSTVATADFRSPFTLQKHHLESRLSFIQKWQFGDENWALLERRYKQRDDDFSLACLLALHRHVPILTYSGQACYEASNMGIAAEHPEHVENHQPASAWRTLR